MGPYLPQTAPPKPPKDSRLASILSFELARNYVCRFWAFEEWPKRCLEGTTRCLWTVVRERVCVMFRLCVCERLASICLWTVFKSLLVDESLQGCCGRLLTLNIEIRVFATSFRAVDAERDGLQRLCKLSRLPQALNTNKTTHINQQPN